MTRRLPWKRTGSGLGDSRTNKTAKPSESAQATTAAATEAGSRVKKQDPSRDGDDIKPTHRKSPASTTKDVTAGIFSDDRASSPPPEPLRETFMRSGIDADDRYRMVEDEFLATAQQFTAHMRAAEYKRLISASRMRNADTINYISRPVVGRMTDLVRMKAERKARSERIRRELKEKKRKKGKDGSGNEHEDEDSGEEVYGSTSLLGLMENPNPRRMAPRLEPISSGILRPGGEDLVNTTMPVRTSPKAVRMVEAAPRPTFTSIPGLNTKRSAEKARQVQGKTSIRVDKDEETTSSEEDLDKPSRNTSFPRMTSRSETKGTSLGGSRINKTSTTANASSPSTYESTRKPIHVSTATQSKISISAKESGAKNSDPTDSDEDDYDVLASLSNRRASAKRRSTGRGGGLGFG